MHRDSYGYEINKTLESCSGGEFVLKEATLYTAFRRLEPPNNPVYAFFVQKFVVYCSMMFYAMMPGRCFSGTAESTTVRRLLI